MSQPFDEVSEAYEAMVDWPRRLANEEPLLRWCVERTRAARVLDAACGTARHVERLASWGLEVEGADISGAMLHIGRQRLGQTPNVTLVQRGFECAIETAQSFDLILCIGNSLSLAPTLEMRRAAVGRFLSAVRPGGGVLIHVMNLWRLPQGAMQWQKSRLADLSGGRRLILKGVHRCGDSGYVDLLVAETASGSTRTDCIEFHGIHAEELREWAAGASELHFFGDYGRSPYDPARSQDLILFARR